MKPSTKPEYCSKCGRKATSFYQSGPRSKPVCLDRCVSNRILAKIIR